MDTTRTFPRTLGQAFGGPSYACAIEAPPRSMLASGWVWVGGVASIVVWTLFVLAVV